MNIKPRDWRLIVLYLAEEATPEQHRQVEERIASDPAFKTKIEGLRQIWQSSFEPNREWDVDEAWRQYILEFGDPREEESDINVAHPEFKEYTIHDTTDRKNSPDRDSVYRFAGIAAAAVAAILIMVLFYHLQDSRSRVKNRQIITKYGQRMHLRLRDGTNIILNAGSKLTVPENFGDSLREVKLTGEAYFQVTHNSRKPFLVHIKKSIIRDLGTRFVVQSYPEDRRLTVAVAEGKIGLHSLRTASDTPLIVLDKNHKGIIKGNGDASVSKISNIESYLGWTKDKLVFDDATLREVGRRLERWYDIKVRFDGSVQLNQRLTASFTAHQQIGEVLDAIALSLNLNYSMHDRTVMLK